MAESSLSDSLETEEDLSRNIAMAVAHILAESEMYPRSNSDASMEFDKMDELKNIHVITRNTSSSGRPHEKKGANKLFVKSKVKKQVKSKSNSKSKSTVGLEIYLEDTLITPKDAVSKDFLQSVDTTTSQAILKGPPVLQPPATTLPRNATMTDVGLYLGRVQSYMNELGYQRQGEPKIRVNTQMSVKHLLDTARSVIKAGEQIKCLHALVLSIYFTNCTQSIERFPINFKSEFGGKEYKHVVLGIYLYGCYGALGISRDNGLQDKSPSFSRLSDMINDFQTCYTESGHTLLEVKIGGIITHDPYSLEPIPWKLHVFNLRKLNALDCATGIERCAKLLRTKMGSHCLRNVRPAENSSAARSRSVLPTVSANANSTHMTRSRKVSNSKYNVNVNASVSLHVNKK